MEQEKDMDWKQIEEMYLMDVCSDETFGQVPAALARKIAEWCATAAEKGYVKGYHAAKGKAK